MCVNFLPLSRSSLDDALCEDGKIRRDADISTLLCLAALPMAFINVNPIYSAAGGAIIFIDSVMAHTQNHGHTNTLTLL